MQLQKRKKAIEEMKLALSLSPQDIELMELLAEIYLLDDQKEKAFEVFKKMSIIDPDNGRIHLTLADYYREQGDNKKSYEELKLAFKSVELDIDTKIRVLV